MTSKLCAIVGSGPGLSQAIAERFGQAGYQLALLSRQPARLDAQVQDLQHQGITVTTLAADAAQADSLIAAFATLREQVGHPDVLIYNAAALTQGSPLTLSAETWLRDFAVNVVGAAIAVQQVVPGMKTLGGGTILLTGGGLGLEPYPAYASLAVGKAGIRNLCFSLAQELQPDNIHVATVTICGFIQPDTKFSPPRIAEAYWQLHQQAPADWEREYVYQ